MRQFFCSAMTQKRSSSGKFGSGSFDAATRIIVSTFATGGRSNTLTRGRISSTLPLPSSWTVMRTRSPASGVTPSLRKIPRALHS